MKREELLTKLAMELTGWPVDGAWPVLPAPWAWEFNGAGEAFVGRCGTRLISQQDWLAERERLINKPSWEEVSEFANYIAQMPSGRWTGFACQPKRGEYGWLGGKGVGELVMGLCPAGHDWRQTLEQRPVEWPGEERIDIVSLNGPTGCHYPQSSGGMKFDSEKPRMDLLLGDMPRALIEVGKVLTFGANKYAPGNWIHVENAEQRYRAAGLRHDLALSMGEQHDSETGLHHLAHEACCILFRLELALREQEATQ